MAAKKPDEEVKTPDKETPPVATPAKDPEKDPKEIKEVEIDTSKIEEEVLESAKKKLAESLVGKEKEKWTPKDYEEIKDTAKKETLEEVDKKLEERDEKAKETKKAKVKEEKEKLEEWNKYWKGQVVKLTEEGHLPKPAEEIQKKLDDDKPLTEEEKKDPALVARVDLYAKASELKESNLELVFHRDMRDKQPPGAAAPVIGTRKSVSPPPSGDDFAYEDVSPRFAGPKTVSELMQKEG